MHRSSAAVCAPNLGRSVMRKPSAALVVASAALAMSTIGTSLAAGPLRDQLAQADQAGLDLARGAQQARAQGPARRSAARADRRAPQGAAGANGAAGTPATKLWAQIARGRRRERVERRGDRPRRRLARHLRGQLRPGHHALRGRWRRRARFPPTPRPEARRAVWRAPRWCASTAQDSTWRRDSPRPARRSWRPRATAAGGAPTATTFYVAVFC